MTVTVLGCSAMILGLYALGVAIFVHLCARAPEMPESWDDTPWPQDASDLFEPANDRRPERPAKGHRHARRLV